jgi:hypothetical protein
MHALCEAADVLGDAGTAWQLHDVIVPYREVPIMPWLAVTCLGSVKRALDVAALTFGARRSAPSTILNARSPPTGCSAHQQSRSRAGSDVLSLSGPDASAGTPRGRIPGGQSAGHSRTRGGLAPARARAQPHGRHHPAPAQDIGAQRRRPLGGRP